MRNPNKTGRLQGILERIFNRRIYVGVYILICFLCCIPATRPFADAPFIVWAFWGVAVAAYDFFTERRMGRGTGSVWLILFLAANAVSVLLNREHALYAGAVSLLINGLLMTVVYTACTADDSRERIVGFLYRVNRMLIVLSTVASSCSLIMYALKLHFRIWDGTLAFRQGFWENRLFGVYTSPNTGALFTIIAVAAVLENAVIKRGNIWKWGALGTACIVLGSLYFSLSLSRGGWMTLAGLLLGLFFVYLMCLGGAASPAKTVWKAAILPILVAAVIGGGILAERQALAYVPGVIERLAPGLEEKLPEEMSEDFEQWLPGERVEQETILTTGRIYIWRAGLAVWKQTPLFGVADADVVDHGHSVSSRISVDGLPAKDLEELEHVSGNLHNSYVEVLVCGGAVSFLLVMAWAASVAKGYISCLTDCRRRKEQPGRDELLIGVLFSMVIAFAVNGFAEANLLFSGRNVYAAVFWLYAGTGLALAGRKKREADGAARSLFLCNTPYQVMQAIRLVQSETVGESDIYIYNRFAQADEIAERLAQTGLFRRVYRFRGFAKGFSYDPYPKPVRLCLTFLAKLFPTAFLRRNCVSGWDGQQGYEKIFLSVFGAFSDPVKLLNPAADILQFEDGLGSYVVGDWNDRRSVAFRMMDRLLFAGRLTYRPTALYLTCPALCPAPEGMALRSIPNSGGTEELKQVFGYRENTVYRENRLVYLAQPRGDAADGRELAKKEQKFFEAAGEDLVVRIHPRADAADYAGCHVDEWGNLWELECAEQITDDHVLIGRFSTAQFTPKMLLDKEPTVVVLREELGIPDERLDRFMTAVRDVYKNPERICTVDSFEELTEWIRRWQASK